MMTAIALAALLGGTPAQPAGNLKLNNVRLTMGEFGPPREGAKLLPGDVLFIAYDIEGLTIDGEGTARYTMSMEVINPNGKPLLQQAPREAVEFVPLRGNRMPARAYVTVGLDEAPGEYNCKLTVTDPKTKATDSLNVKFEVLKKDFGVVAVNTSHDAAGELSAPSVGQVGQLLYVHFSVAAFGRDQQTKNENVEVEFQFYDDKGTPLLVDASNKPTPRKHVQDEKSALPVKKTDEVFRLQFPLFLNRPGKFNVEIKATDKITKKTSVFKLPITINEAAK